METETLRLIDSILRPAASLAGQPDQRTGLELRGPGLGGELARPGDHVQEHVDVGAGVAGDDAAWRQGDDIGVQVPGR
jgi:hypothetical protein